MNWKSIALPRPLWIAFKRGRRLRTALRVLRGRLLLRLGKPRLLHAFVKERRLRARIVLMKQGCWSLVSEHVFLRFALRPKAQRRLRDEVEQWQRMKALGFGDILVDRVQLHELGGGVLLESTRLYPIREEEQVRLTLPVLRALTQAAEVITSEALPESIEAGLKLLGPHPDDREFEEHIRGCLVRPLRQGLSHLDLHLRNVMKDEQGRAVLIDLKSCRDHQVLALDLLNFVCKYFMFRTGRNVLDQALVLHREGWDCAGFEEVFDLIDLPRSSWGPLYALHVIGRVSLKSPQRNEALRDRLRQVIRRI